ncbi:MAG: polysaccharide deacetylase family protein [Firmicutes bacterium]|nr:polysaccharide deacetylase family protein [Bacillota bacterium]
MRRFFYIFLVLLIIFLGIIVSIGTTTYEEEARGFVPMPIIMFHAVVPDKYSPNPYIIRISDLIKDLDYIKNAGYETILPRDLVAYTELGVPLPKKPIMLTFDDGFYGVKSLVMPELKKRGQKAVVPVVGQFMKDELKNDARVTFSYLLIEETKELEDSGLIEIGHHSNNLHELRRRKGIKKLKSESQENYEKMFKKDTVALMEKLAEYEVFPVSYAYPFGAFDKNSNSLLKDMGFKVTFSCIEGVNKITRDKECLFGLKRYNRSGTGKSVEMLLGKK